MNKLDDILRTLPKERREYIEGLFIGYLMSLEEKEIADGRQYVSTDEDTGEA